MAGRIAWEAALQWRPGNEDITTWYMIDGAFEYFLQSVNFYCSLDALKAEIR